MTEGPESQQAGWYPDPEMAETVRYWDGSAWTDHRAPANPQEAPAPPATAAVAEKKPVSSSTIGCLALVGIVIVSFIVMAVVGGGDKGAFQVCQSAIVAQLPAGNPDWTVSDAETRDFPGGMEQATGTVKVNDVEYFYECQVIDGKVDKLSVGQTGQ